MTAYTRVTLNPYMTATRYLRKLPYPNDITEIPSLVSGLIIQADYDVNDPGSLTRNRVSDTAMTVVGAPELVTYGVVCDEQNYIDTNIDISAYNADDMSMIVIADRLTAGQAGLVGHLVLTGTQRYRGVLAAADKWTAKWLTSGIVNQEAAIAVSTPEGYSEFVAARFIRDAGDGSMMTKVRTQRNLAEFTRTAAITPANMPSATMKIGATASGSGTSEATVRAVLVFNRALSDEEMALIYQIYANYYEYHEAGFSL